MTDCIKRGWCDNPEHVHVRDNPFPDWSTYLLDARKALATAEAAAALGNWPDALAAAHHAQTHTTDLGDAIVRAAFTEAAKNDR